MIRRVFICIIMLLAEPPTTIPILTFSLSITIHMSFGKIITLKYGLNGLRCDQNATKVVGCVRVVCKTYTTKELGDTMNSNNSTMRKIQLK
jgi:hypothetical protein